MGLLSNFSKTASSYYKSGMSVASVKSWLAEVYLDELHSKDNVKIEEKEVSIKDIE